MSRTIQAPSMKYVATASADMKPILQQGVGEPIDEVDGT